MVGIWIKILGEAFWSDIQKHKEKTSSLYCQALPLLWKRLLLRGLFATKERKRYKAAAMTFFLISAVTYAFVLAL